MNEIILIIYRGQGMQIFCVPLLLKKLEIEFILIESAHAKTKATWICVLGKLLRTHR